MKLKTPSSLVKVFVSASLAASSLVGGAATVRVGAQTERKATQQTPALSRYASDLTRLACLGQLDAAGHEADARKTVEILSRGSKNPVLLAGSGAEAAAVARGVAVELASAKAPASLRGARVFSLNRDALTAGTKTKDEFVARLKSVLEDAAAARGRVVLFVADFHQFAGTYASREASELVRAALARGDLKVIGATNPETYKNQVANDAALARLVQPVELSAEAAGEGESAGITMSDARLAPDLREMVAGAKPNERVGVILQADDLNDPELSSLLRRYNADVKSRMDQVGAMRVELPAEALRELAKTGAAGYLSPDRPMLNLGHVTATTGTDQIRTQPAGSIVGGVPTTSSTTLDGTGVAVAVIDSGVAASHMALLGRVVFSKDFTGEGRTDDPYGHGTHVASAVAGSAPGNSTGTGTSYQGVAPGANVVNLRVLKSDGTGTSSALLNALNWILSPADPTQPPGATNPTNAVKYNIRVVNMSLGAPAVDSYKNDPICKAARALVNAGIVVVCAAGNNGKDSQGNKLYGQIHSPGDEPSVITVGAVNTFGTDSRSDDVIATYSSRGPTRGSWTDASGVKHYDNLIKPDLSAPGNKVIFAESDYTPAGTSGGSVTALNYLVTNNPGLDASAKNQSGMRYMYLSGTSMASPAVAGAAALLFQANPKLTPNMVKMILEYTAQPLAGFNELEQGSGELNVAGAVQLAQLVRTDMTSATKQGDPLLVTSTLPDPHTTIAGYTFPWAQGVILKRNYATGTSLITKYQTVYGLGMVIGDGIMMSDGTVVGDGIIMSDGVVTGYQLTTSAGMVIGDGSPFLSCGILAGDGIMMADGMVVGDGILMGDGMVVGDGIMMGDAALQAMSAAMGGDDGPAMPKPTPQP